MTPPPKKQKIEDASKDLLAEALDKVATAAKKEQPAQAVTSATAAASGAPAPESIMEETAAATEQTGAPPSLSIMELLEKDTLQDSTGDTAARKKSQTSKSVACKLKYIVCWFSVEGGGKEKCKREKTVECFEGEYEMVTRF